MKIQIGSIFIYARRCLIIYRYIENQGWGATVESLLMT